MSLQDIDHDLAAFGVTEVQTEEGLALVRRGPSPLLRTFSVGEFRKEVDAVLLERDFDLVARRVLRDLCAAVRFKDAG